MYKIYLGSLALPVAPSKMDITINNKNRTIDLINGGEINIIKGPGLSDVSFDALFPTVKYPWAKSSDAESYLSRLESMKRSKQPFQFIINRYRAGKHLFNDNFKCTLEDYKIKEDAERQGTDVVVTIKLKEYVPYSTKIMILPVQPQAKKVAAPVPKRAGVPARAGNSGYTVKGGDCLWNIAKEVYGDGSRYKEIAEANPQISNPNLIYPGQELKIP